MNSHQNHIRAETTTINDKQKAVAEKLKTLLAEQQALDEEQKNLEDTLAKLTRTELELEAQAAAIKKEKIQINQNKMREIAIINALDQELDNANIKLNQKPDDSELAGKHSLEAADASASPRPEKSQKTNIDAHPSSASISQITNNNNNNSHHTAISTSRQLDVIQSQLNNHDYFQWKKLINKDLFLGTNDQIFQYFQTELLKNIAEISEKNLLTTLKEIDQHTWVSALYWYDITCKNVALISILKNTKNEFFFPIYHKLLSKIYRDKLNLSDLFSNQLTPNHINNWSGKLTTTLDNAWYNSSWQTWLEKIRDGLNFWIPLAANNSACEKVLVIYFENLKNGMTFHDEPFPPEYSNDSTSGVLVTKLQDNFRLQDNAKINYNKVLEILIQLTPRLSKKISSKKPSSSINSLSLFAQQTNHNEIIEIDNELSSNASSKGI
jgi:hypothetical protein